VAKLIFLSQIDQPPVKLASVALSLFKEQALFEAVYLRSCIAGLNNAWSPTSNAAFKFGAELSKEMASPYLKADKNSVQYFIVRITLIVNDML
jgi:hypothetical protein